MAGVFDLNKGAFDSSEAGRLHKAYDIALSGLRASHEVDPAVVQRLARSIVKVARTEPDCLKNDGTIDVSRLAQRAILRMLQISAPTRQFDALGDAATTSEPARRKGVRSGSTDDPPAQEADDVLKTMRRLFDHSIFAKL